MQVLLFEMEPRDGHEAHYFSHVEKLRPLLAKHEGLLFIDRFKSLSRPKIILSHSLWKDEAAISKWRTDATHHQSQAAGRYQHFVDYRIRISHALEVDNRDENPSTWSAEGSYRSADAADTRLLVITASKGEPYKGSGELFTSVNHQDTYLTIKTAASTQEATRLAQAAKQDTSVTRVIISNVSRDYGMFDRDEAPQYFKPAN
ncbi:MAG: antibiotic biosynthesis monooxygenase family protein [Hyphomicrobiales bacterium]